MPGPRAATHRRWRRTALAVCALGLGTAAACSSSPSAGHPAGPAATTSSTLAAPWQGALVTATLPAPVQSLQAVSCATAARCWAVGSTVATGAAPSGPVLVATRDGGVTWKVQALPPGLGYLADVACATARACTVVGQVGAGGAGPGAILTTTDGGSTWVSRTVPAGTTDVTAVACRTGGTCLALGTVAGRVTALTPTGGGAAWVAGGQLPAAASVATSLSCADATHCWATASDTVDPSHAVGSIDATADDGQSWAPATLPTGTGAVNAVSCTPATSSSGRATGSCTAVGTTATVSDGSRTGQAVVLVSSAGGPWTSAPVPAGAADLLGVSCGAGPCVAVGATPATADHGGVVVLTRSAGASGTTWRVAASVPVALPLTAVSCVSLQACTVVGESVSAHLAAA